MIKWRMRHAVCCKTVMFPMRYADCQELFADHNGYFHTDGPDWKGEPGNYYFLGRKTSVIHYNGQKINRFEIENEITYKIPKRIHIADGLPRTVSGKVICHETGYKGVNNNY